MDEDEQRVMMFTSALTSERAIKCGVGAFQYQGATITSADHNRMHENNLQIDQVRHGYGECMYSSGASYKGDWRNESQWVNCSKNLSLLRDAIDNYDADVNETDDLGRTPLMLACSYATNQNVVALLLQKGATPRTTTVVKPLAT